MTIRGCNLPPTSTVASSGRRWDVDHLLSAFEDFRGMGLVDRMIKCPTLRCRKYRPLTLTPPAASRPAITAIQQAIVLFYIWDLAIISMIGPEPHPRRGSKSLYYLTQQCLRLPRECDISPCLYI